MIPTICVIGVSTLHRRDSGASTSHCPRFISLSRAHLTDNDDPHPRDDYTRERSTIRWNSVDVRLDRSNHIPIHPTSTSSLRPKYVFSPGLNRSATASKFWHDPALADLEIEICLWLCLTSFD